MKKKIIVLMLLVLMMLTGCSYKSDQEQGYPYVKYQHSIWSYDNYNKLVEVPDGYVLNQGHSYDVVETEDGYDIVFHFTKNESD